jgi:cephalosporin hydroxylase
MFAGERAMKIIIDTDAKTLETHAGSESQRQPLFSKRSFQLISELWIKTGWAQRYSYTFTWLGRPIIQLPEDVLRIQEVIYRVKPDIIIETGIARGGSLIFYASLLELLGKGIVIGIDIEIRPHNRSAIESHPMASRVAMIEGSSTDPDIVKRVAQRVTSDDRVLVILDSNHTRKHVLDELRAYAPLVSTGSYAVATDGIMNQLTDVPGGNPSWGQDNPEKAARDFVAESDDFVIEEPDFLFRESELNERISYWPGAFVKRVR